MVGGVMVMGYRTYQNILLRQTEAARIKSNIPEFLYQTLGQNETVIKQTLNFIKDIKFKNVF